MKEPERDRDRPEDGDGGGAGGSGVIIAGHYDEPDTYVTKRPEGRDDWLLTYTLGGRGYFVTREGTTHCRQGDVVLLRPGTPQHYGTAKGERWHFVWAHFSHGLLETGLLPDVGLHVQRLEGESQRRRLLRAFRRLLADFRERGPYWRELCENALREMLLLLAGRLGKPGDPRIEEALHLLSANMREPVRIDELARAVGLSPSRLSHLFKETTGSSVVETLNAMRLRQAALLLEHTDRTASEVAFDVGFRNYNHFLNQFRKRYGVGPGSYRKRERGR
ncbi:helix-turn-helix domain-containing protein [Paenibacillus flagellatus]|uniref:AraC family transcriptional regulator n=1 Tax=Paenibacillus flagellatus TaxID=2211139 RepID=A0A2V5K9X5_9BACL|nr:helix-turn-helix domain-containing protein [Paenibacillus flagellatus]PYI56208.1 AraC family transcriptional regulator [Paenibacillus flagellatus]